jgi:hypothetical protein
MQKEGLNHSCKKNHSLINYNYGGFLLPSKQINPCIKESYTIYSIPVFQALKDTLQRSHTVFFLFTNREQDVFMNIIKKTRVSDYLQIT